LFAGALLVANFSAEDGFSQPTQDFRIETDVLLVDRAEPVHQSVTIFREGAAYDYSRNEPHRITIVDPANSRIVFLDSRREVQARVNLNDLNQFMEGARKEISKSNLAEALSDADIVDVDQSKMRVTVGKKFCRYEAVLQKPELESAVNLYAMFANVSASINSWHSPDRSPPSFARIKLNETIQQLGLIPSEIERTIVTNKGHEQTLRSRLHVRWSISAEDQKSVDKFLAMLMVYPSLEVGEFMAHREIVTR
jgi:hypothetical protein